MESTASYGSLEANAQRVKDAVLEPAESGAGVALDRNLLSFGARDEFYEGRFVRSTSPPAETPLYRALRFAFYRISLHGERARPLLRAGKVAGTTLDFGCGGGRDYLAQSSETSVGIDLSLESCRRAAAFYDLVVHAGQGALPFRDGAFRRVVSIDVLGHVPLEEKDALLAELFRVTAPGGSHFHFAELEPQRGWFVFAKRSPDFRERFIDEDGHIALETPARYCERFERAGFTVEGARPVFGFFWPAGEWAKRFAGWNGPPALPPFLRVMTALDVVLSKNELSLAVWDVALRTLTLLFGRLGGPDWGTMGSFLLRKPER